MNRLIKRRIMKMVDKWPLGRGRAQRLHIFPGVPKKGFSLVSHKRCFNYLRQQNYFTPYAAYAADGKKKCLHVKRQDKSKFFWLGLEEMFPRFDNRVI